MVLGLFGLSVLMSLLAYCLRKSLRLIAVVVLLVVVVPVFLLAVVFGHMPG